MFLKAFPLEPFLTQKPVMAPKFPSQNEHDADMHHNRTDASHYSFTGVECISLTETLDSAGAATVESENSANQYQVQHSELTSRTGVVDRKISICGQPSGLGTGKVQAVACAKQDE